MTTMPGEDAKKRRDDRTPRPGGNTEPHVPEHDPAELENDQADSGPDRDRQDLGT